jgi:hypothetical protein
MKNFLNISFALFCLFNIVACASNEASLDPDNTSEVVSWKTYTSENLGFSLDIPNRVLRDFNDESSWASLNVYETDNTVYFSTADSLEATLENRWEFKIGGSSLSSEDEVLTFLESFYGVEGCSIEISENEETDASWVFISAKDRSLMPDDPMSCFIGGVKNRTFYDEESEKLITYRLLERFFFIPGGSLDEKALASLDFKP